MRLNFSGLCAQQPIRALRGVRMSASSSGRFDELIERTRREIIPTSKFEFYGLDTALLEAQKLSGLSPEEFSASFGFIQALLPTLNDASLGRFYKAHKPRFTPLIAQYTALGRTEISRRMIALRTMLPGDGDLGLLVAWWPRIMLDQFDQIEAFHSAMQRAAHASKQLSAADSISAGAPLQSPFRAGEVLRLEDASDFLDSWRTTALPLPEYTDRLAQLLTACPAILTAPALQKEPERVGRVITNAPLLLERAASLPTSVFPGAEVAACFEFAQRAPILLLNDELFASLPEMLRGLEALFPWQPVRAAALRRPGLLFLQSPDDLLGSERAAFRADPAAFFAKEIFTAADDRSLQRMIFNGAGVDVLEGAQGWGLGAADRMRQSAGAAVSTVESLVAQRIGTSAGTDPTKMRAALGRNIPLSALRESPTTESESDRDQGPGAGDPEGEATQ